MKLLENASLEAISLYMQNNARDFDLDFRLESFSCKMVSTDKKEWRRNIRNSNDKNQLQPLSPPEEQYLSQFGNFNTNGRLRHTSEVSLSGSDNDADENYSLVGTVSRRTLFNLVAVLNLSYSDYDFSQTKSERFSLANIEDCIANVNAKLIATVPAFMEMKDRFWGVINEEIRIDECILYSYIPEYTNDPFTEDGCIWAFNYMFWNRNLKRILFLCCRALRSASLDISSEQLWVDDE
ncbi:Repressor of RNA polymerase III transcription MAF1 [Aphelenchoides besseyi]|nr:Repressor of RNA polymerase III transcription MAF1 [Aphelenchoides besseyi]